MGEGLVSCEGLLTPLAVSSMTRGVGGSIVGYQLGHVDSVYGFSITLMESVSRMVPPTNTSGASLVVTMNRVVVAPV